MTFFPLRVWAEEPGSINNMEGKEAVLVTNPFQPKLPKKIIPKTEKEPEQISIKEPPPVTQNMTPPTKPAEKPVPPPLTITGVVWNTDRPQAIINGQVVDQGDVVSEVKIVSIKKTSIGIEFQGSESTLTP